MKNLPIEKTVLPNGFTVISDYVPYVKSVSIGLWILTGSRDEEKDCNGVSHLIEHLVFKGTKKRNYIQISQSLERVGGYLNAFTTKEQTCYYANILGEYIELATDILFDIVFNPTFPVEEFEKEKSVILEELRGIDDTPDDLIFEEFDKLIYKGHPLALPIAGSISSVKKIDRKKTLQFLKENYPLHKMMIVASGNVQHKQLVDVSKKFLSKSTQKKLPTTQKKLYNTQTYKSVAYKEVQKPISQSHAVIGIPFDRNDNVYFPTLLLNTILGGGMSSRLNLEFREKLGLAYTIYSMFSTYDETNSFVVYLATDSRKIKNTISLIENELDKIASSKIPEKELQVAKMLHKGGILMGEENMGSRMNQLARDEYYFKEFLSTEEVLDKIMSIQPKEILSAAQTLFKKENFSTLCFVPKKR